MNYIYDILLNFQNDIFEFYDWYPEDSILHIRKIPVIKISAKNLNDVKTNKIEFEDTILKKIKNKTEIFLIKSIKSLEYAFLLSDGVEVIAINIQNGEYTYSKLLIDEEEDVLDVVLKMEEQELNYNIISKQNIYNFNTRKELEIKKYIKLELEKLLKENNLDKLKYIYLECFNLKEENKTKIINKIKNEIDTNFSIVGQKLYDIFQLFQTA